MSNTVWFISPEDDAGMDTAVRPWLGTCAPADLHADSAAPLIPVGTRGPRKRSHQWSPSGQPAQHEADHADVDDDLAGAAEPFVVLT